MDQSKARPSGSVDWSRFRNREQTSKNLSEGKTNSNYLEETREQDPWPEEESSTLLSSVLLKEVAFVTPQEELQTYQNFTMSCQAMVKESTSELKITFQLIGRYTNQAGQPTEENLHLEGFEGFIPSHYEKEKTYLVSASGKLYAPQVPPGTMIEYQLIASHQASGISAESAVVQVTHQWPIHLVEIPDLLFHHNGNIPCLDEEKYLVRALATTLMYAEQEAPLYQSNSKRTKMQEELVVFGHTDTSGDIAFNDELSERRAQAVQSLLNQDEETWKNIASTYGKTEDYQQILTMLHQIYGWECDPGEVDNQKGPKTRSALQSFQAQVNQLYQMNLVEDGLIGPKTWGSIHRVLCGLIAQTLGLADPHEKNYPVWDIPEYGYAQGKGCFGCGESFPIEEKYKDHYRSQKNRRVDLIFMPRGYIHLEKPTNRNETLQTSQCICYDDQCVTRLFVSLLTDSSDSIQLDFLLPSDKKFPCQAILSNSQGESKTIPVVQKSNPDRLHFCIPATEDQLKYSLQLKFDNKPPQWLFRDECFFNLGLGSQIENSSYRPVFNILKDQEDWSEEENESLHTEPQNTSLFNHPMEWTGSMDDLHGSYA